MAEWLRVLVGVAEDPSSVSSTYNGQLTVTYNSNPRRTQCPLLASWALQLSGTHTMHIHTCKPSTWFFLTKWNSPNMEYAYLSSKYKDSFYTCSHLQSKHGKHSVALGLVTHACSPSIQEAEARGSGHQS